MDSSLWRGGPVSIDHQQQQQQQLEADVLAREISGRAAMEVNMGEWSLSGLSDLLVSTPPPPPSERSPPPVDTSSVQYETARKGATADKECAPSILPLATTTVGSPRCSMQHAGVLHLSAPCLLLRALGAAEEASARRITQQARRCAEKGEGTPLHITKSFGTKLEWSDFPSLGPNSSVRSSR